MWRWISVTAMLVGCGEGRVVLELHGDVTNVGAIGVVLAEPAVEIRNQRTNGTDPGGKELVAYLAQAEDIAVYDHDAATPIEGFRIQLGDTGSDAFVPIVIAFTDDTLVQRLGLGVHEPERLFAQDLKAAQIKFVSNEVRVYGIDLEPITVQPPSATPVAVGDGQLLEVFCGPEPSGWVWRHAGTHKEFRLLASAIAHDLRAADLDCDHHTAGINGQARETGDQSDCDDTVSTSYGGSPAAERVCTDGYDNDCDFRPDFAPSDECAICATAGGQAVGMCDDRFSGNSSGPTPSACTPSKCHDCGLAATFDPDVNNTTAHICPVTTQLPLDQCSAGCQVTLIAASPEYIVKIGTSSPDTGVGGTVVVTGTNPMITVSIEGAMSYPSGSMPSGSFTLYVNPESPDETPMTYGVSLTPTTPTTSCQLTTVVCSG